MPIPQIPLNQLERDPIVHFGCTYAEIVSCALHAIWKGLIPGFVAGAFIHISVGIIVGFALWLLISYLSMRKISKTRADKPLFYEVHLVRKKSGRFIRPSISYQRERNEPRGD